MASTEFTHDANDIRVTIDGIEFHLFENVRGTMNFNLTAVSGIGDNEAREHAPGRADFSITLNGYIERTEKAISSGIIPENGPVTVQGETFDVEIFRKDGPLLEKYIKAKCSNAETDLRAHALYMKNFTLLARTRQGAMAG